MRRKTAGVPEAQAFSTKPEIASAQMRQAVAAGVPMGVVLADAGYGDETAFRDGLTALDMRYAVGILQGTTVWAPGTAPLPPKAWVGHGKKATKLRRAPGNEPVTVKALTMALLAQAWSAYLARRHQRRSQRAICRVTRASCTSGAISPPGCAPRSGC